jgi:hypothetical protein
MIPALLALAQAASEPATSHLLGTTKEWGLDGAFDAGWARQPGYGAVDATGVAAGLRLFWDRAVICRVEVGRAVRGGDATLYVSFGDQF